MTDNKYKPRVYHGASGGPSAEFMAAQDRDPTYQRLNRKLLIAMETGKYPTDTLRETLQHRLEDAQNFAKDHKILTGTLIAVILGAVYLVKDLHDDSNERQAIASVLPQGLSLPSYSDDDAQMKVFAENLQAKINGMQDADLRSSIEGLHELLKSDEINHDGNRITALNAQRVVKAEKIIDNYVMTLDQLASTDPSIAEAMRIILDTQDKLGHEAAERYGRKHGANTHSR